jgi:predicted DNA-binding protein (UPF0251 family)
MKKGKFTAEVQDRIIAALQSGAFLHVAAEAAGVHRSTIWNWMNSPGRRYRAFQARVREAIAHARLTAEITVFKADPKFWLRCGPGRQRYDEDGRLVEGWTEAVNPEQKETQQVNILMSPEWEAIRLALETALHDNPEALQKVTQALLAVKHPPKAITE